jgi:5-formyltetrahydrofolate cyclo-ligase
MTSSKAKIRKGALHNRRLLSDEVWSERCEAVRHGVLEIIKSKRVKTCHVFLPISRNRELDTWPLVNLLHDGGVSVIVSVSDFETCTMSHFYFHPEVKFVFNKFNIPEPENAESAKIQVVEMVLIPLLAADKKGNRIGYGKGFYDRLLSEMPQSVIKVGVNLCPLFDAFDFAEPHDVTLDYCVTPHQIYNYHE